MFLIIQLKHNLVCKKLVYPNYRKTFLSMNSCGIFPESIWGRGYSALVTCMCSFFPLSDDAEGQ